MDSIDIGFFERKINVAHYLIHHPKDLCTEMKLWNNYVYPLKLPPIGENTRSPYQEIPQDQHRRRSVSRDKQNANNKFARKVPFKNRKYDETERPSRTSDKETITMDKETQTHDFHHDKKKEKTKEKEENSSEDRRRSSLSSKNDGRGKSSDNPEPVPVPRRHKMTSKPPEFKFTMIREGGGSMEHPDYVRHPIQKHLYEKQTNDDFNFVIRSQRPESVSVSNQKDLFSWTATLSRATKGSKTTSNKHTLREW